MTRARTRERKPTYITTPGILQGLPEGVVVQDQDTQAFYRANGDGGFSRVLGPQEAIDSWTLWRRLRTPPRITHIPEKYLPKRRHYRRRIYPKGNR